MTIQKKKNGKLVILSSPSGGGKSTICKKLRKKLPAILYSISTTTRPPRKGEKNGKQYFFVTKKYFENMIKKNVFLEWAIVHGNYYGTGKDIIENGLKQGKTCILDVDIQGAMQIKKKYPGGLFIFVMPPSMEELKSRLKKRGTDNNQSIEIRLNNAKKEIEYKKYYDYIVINKEIEHSVNKIVDIINKN